MRNFPDQPYLEFDRLIKLSVVEDELRRVVDPIPCRHTIVGWLEEGLIEGKQLGPGRYWFAYLSSVRAFITEYYTPRQQKLAA